MQVMEMTIGEKSFDIELEDSITTQALMQRLPLSFAMTELNGNEKYVYLDVSLPMNASYSGQIHAGGVMLFGDDCLVLFYKNFRTIYSYTPIGKVSDAKSLQSALGRGKVTVQLSLKK